MAAQAHTTMYAQHAHNAAGKQTETHDVAQQEGRQAVRKKQERRDVRVPHHRDEEVEQDDAHDDKRDDNDLGQEKFHHRRRLSVFRVSGIRIKKKTQQSGGFSSERSVWHLELKV
jgi:hypothetical protein